MVINQDERLRLCLLTVILIFRWLKHKGYLAAASLHSLIVWVLLQRARRKGMSLIYCKEDENVAGRELKCRGEWILSRNYDIVFIWFIFSIFLKLSRFCWPQHRQYICCWQLSLLILLGKTNCVKFLKFSIACSPCRIAFKKMVLCVEFHTAINFLQYFHQAQQNTWSKKWKIFKLFVLF